MLNSNRKANQYHEIVVPGIKGVRWSLKKNLTIIHILRFYKILIISNFKFVKSKILGSNDQSFRRSDFKLKRVRQF